jgi:hypothetical protein
MQEFGRSSCGIRLHIHSMRASGRRVPGFPSSALAGRSPTGRLRDDLAPAVPITTNAIGACLVGQPRLRRPRTPVPKPPPIVALPSATGGERVVGLTRQRYPQLRIRARVPERDSVARLRAAGASAVVVDGLTTARDRAERTILLYEPAAVDQAPAAQVPGQ